MITRTYGYIPLPADLAKQESVAAAAVSLTSVCTGGGVIVDKMGLGKTLLALLFIGWVCQHGPPKSTHRPILVLLPSSIVLSQWLQNAIDWFPYIDTEPIDAPVSRETRHRA